MKDLPSPYDDTPVITDIEATVEKAADLVATGEIELGSIVIDVDEVWDREKERIEAYVLCGCSCQYGPDESPCHRLFSATQYEEMRNECRELSRDELDLVIMGELRALTFRDLITWRNEGRRRTISYYQFGGHPVCKNTFCFLHNIGISKLNAIKASWLKNGLRPRERKHTTPHNTTKLSDIKLVVRYILNYAEDHAILLPGRVPGFKRDNIQLLLSSVTKREVWVAYHEATTQCEGVAVVCYSLFCQLWRQLTPQIVMSKPMSDLCWTCQKNSSLIMQAHNRPVEEKTEVIIKSFV